MGILIKRKGNCGSGNDRPKVIRYRQKSWCGLFEKFRYVGPLAPRISIGPRRQIPPVKTDRIEKNRSLEGAN